MAPLAGYTAYPFRMICRSLGAGLAFTEMVSANGLKYNDKATAKLLYTSEAETPKAVQLLGSALSAFEIGGILHLPFSCALIGIGTHSQADAAMVEYPPVNISFDEVIGRLSERFSPIRCTRCQRCVCPKGYEVHIMLRQYNYYHLGKTIGR